ALRSNQLLRGSAAHEDVHFLHIAIQSLSAKTAQYYVSQPYRRGLATPPIGAIVRVPAPDIEAVVTNALREYLARSDTAAAQASSADQPNIRAMVARIEVRNSHLALWLMHPGQGGADETAAPPAPIEENSALLIPWTKPPAKR